MQELEKVTGMNTGALPPTVDHALLVCPKLPRHLQDSCDPPPEVRNVHVWRCKEAEIQRHTFNAI